MPVPLVVIDSPFRETVHPVLRYVRQLRRETPGDVVSVVIPEYVVDHWWETSAAQPDRTEAKRKTAASSHRLP